MRHLPKFSDDYGFGGDDLAGVAILSADVEDLVEAIGDDWSLVDAEELELDTVH
ncbi:MAG: hypothetical protein HQ481_08735 [Alphaproteobacteria bacterium]|nr:hypothetical protein [Alphaproteobacteria bacterium]